MTSTRDSAAARLALGLLDAHDLLQRPDRDLDLVERRLPRRQPLQPQARREQRHQDAVALVLAGVADQLVGEPGDHRQQEDPADDEPVPDRAGRRSAKTKMPITMTQSKKAVPQRGWIKLNFCTFSGRQLGAALERVDRLVLGAVVLEDALQVGQQPDQDDVER